MLPHSERQRKQHTEGTPHLRVRMHSTRLRSVLARLEYDAEKHRQTAFAHSVTGGQACGLLHQLSAFPPKPSHPPVLPPLPLVPLPAQMPLKQANSMRMKNQMKPGWKATKSETRGINVGGTAEAAAPVKESSHRAGASNRGSRMGAGPQS